jgi:hypothetical protein
MDDLTHRIFESIRRKEDDDVPDDDVVPPEIGDDGSEEFPSDDSSDFAPDANMTIKDDGESDTPDGSIPAEPGMIDLAKASEKASKAGLHALDDEKSKLLDLYDLYDGAKHEMEHTPDFDLAVAIAAIHLLERPDYYEVLNKAMSGPDDEAPGSSAQPKREPYHSMDMHDGEGEDDGW